MSNLFANFIMSKRYVDDLSKENDTAPATPGYMYNCGCWISNNSTNKEPHYYTIVGNSQSSSHNLRTVEEFLWFNWADTECDNGEATMKEQVGSLEALDRGMYD